MEVALINPDTEGTRYKGWLKKIFLLSRSTFPALAAYTPEFANLTVFDETVEEIDFGKHFDLAGITVQTSAAPRAYEISDILRQKGTRVILGGTHVSHLPDEAMQHADAIALYNGETTWPAAIIDLEESGGIKPRYNGASFDYLNRRLPRRDVLKGKALQVYQTIETSRGCPYDCNFCTIPGMYDKKVMQFSVDSVIQDIKNLPDKYIFFSDDNFMGNPKHADAIFQKMIDEGLRKTWLTQTTVWIASDRERPKLAAKSGCIAVYIGFESVANEGDNYKKNNVVFESGLIGNRQERYREVVKRLHDAGIGVEGGFIFGLDTDGPDIFEKTLDFVQSSEMDTVSFHILTPYPGTALYNEMKASSRILHENWEKYNTRNVVFQPRKMTPEQLQEGYNLAWREAYTLKNITQRSMNSNHPLYAWLYNFIGKANKQTPFE